MGKKELVGKPIPKIFRRHFMIFCIIEMTVREGFDIKMIDHQIDLETRRKKLPPAINREMKREMRKRFANEAKKRG
ncbi:MAG: hypothetical protein KGH93_03180 [Patescibacteria group bacterium]|nr:hypothetical protein [Patescibacteria group bacterium]MDE1946173.1 hypothetical protein [Patescibacteria group bacterium]